MSRIISKYSIASYYILALILGAVITYLVVQRVLPAGFIFVAASSASLSGIIITAIADGKDGLKKLFGRLLIWRIGIGYWAFALFILPPTILLGLYLSPFFGGEPIDLSNIQPLYIIVPMLIMTFITAGLGEEIGWTGFLTPRLQTHYNALVSSIIRGVLWGLWHFPLFIFSGLDHPILEGFPYADWVAQKGFLIAMGSFILMNQIPWSVFYTWMFNNSKGSLLLPAILHGSEVWMAYWVLSTGINQGNYDNYWGYGLIMVLIAVIIVLTNGARNLSRKKERVIHQ
jgi:membrane protease YdiL (CAAX protease family)